MQKAFLFILLISLTLTGCAVPAMASGPASVPLAPANSAPTRTPLVLPTAESVVEGGSQSALTPDPSTGVGPNLADAEQSARDYFAALEEGKFDQAAGQLSTFGLMVERMTRGDAASLLTQQHNDGRRWSGLEVLDSRMFDQTTALVHVRYNLAMREKAGAGAAAPTPTPTEEVAQPEVRDELWPMRLEGGEWRYNWQNLIDYRTLDARDQTMNGITVKPVRLLRFSDRMQLVLIVQNRTNEPVVFGQRNETLATFFFGEQAVAAEPVQFIFDRLRSYPDARLDILGLWETYPNQVEIRRWKDYQVDPWYTFDL